MVVVVKIVLFVVDGIFKPNLQFANESAPFKLEVNQKVSVAGLQSILNSHKSNILIFRYIVEDIPDLFKLSRAFGSKQVSDREWNYLNILTFKISVVVSVIDFLKY